MQKRSVNSVSNRPRKNNGKFYTNISYPFTPSLSGYGLLHISVSKVVVHRMFILSRKTPLFVVIHLGIMRLLNQSFLHRASSLEYFCLITLMKNRFSISRGYAETKPLR